MRQLRISRVILLAVCLLAAGGRAHSQSCITYEHGASDAYAESNCGVFTCTTTRQKYWNIYWRDQNGAVTANRSQYPTKGTGVRDIWSGARCDPIFFDPVTTASAGDSSVWEQRVVSMGRGTGG